MVIDAAAAAVRDYLPYFIERPTKHDEAIARCTILQMIAPKETTPDFLEVVYNHRFHKRATKRFLERVGSHGILVLTGATLEAMDGCRQ